LLYPLEKGPLGNEDSILMFSGKTTKGIFLHAQALATSSSSMFPTQHDPLTYKCLFCNLILGHARKYS
jgi:hypothetical protein